MAAASFARRNHKDEFQFLIATPHRSIAVESLCDGRLAKYGIEEKLVPGNTDQHQRCLTDGDSELWVLKNKHDGLVEMFCATHVGYDKMLDAICEEFDTPLDMTEAIPLPRKNGKAN